MRWSTEPPHSGRDRVRSEIKLIFHVRAHSRAAGGVCRVEAQTLGHANLAPAIRPAKETETH